MLKITNEGELLPHEKLVQYVQEKHPDIFPSHVEMLQENKSIHVCLFMEIAKYVDNGTQVRILFEEGHVDISTVLLDQYVQSYRSNKKWIDIALDLKMSYVITVNWRDFIVKKRKATVGQNKLMVTTMMTLLDMESEIRMLVIGSSSEDTINCGRTYEALIDYLGLLGYHGTMVFLDPYEVDRSYKTEHFIIETRSKYYDYDGPPLLDPEGKEFTVVIDDVWIPCLTRLPVPVPEYKKKRLDLKDGRSKFAYRVVDGVLEMKNKLRNHSDLQGAIGGGYMYKEGKRIIVSGTSTKCGHYDEEVVQKALSHYDISFRSEEMVLGRYKWDREANIFSQYPKARISLKYFGESYDVEHKIYDQIWYKGLEKRLLYGCKLFPLEKNYGCGCNHCMYYGTIFKNFKIYKGDKSILRAMMARVIRDRCLGRKGSNFQHVLGLWMSAAHKNSNYRSTVEAIATGVGCSSRVVERGYQYLLRIGKISKKDFVCDIDERRFTRPVLRDGVTVYVDKATGEYLSGGKIFSRYGAEITTKFLDGSLVYRPGLENREKEMVVSYFAFKYRMMWNSIVGYDFVMHGSQCCGFSDEYTYFISHDTYEYVVIDTYLGWKIYYPDGDLPTGSYG